MTGVLLAGASAAAFACGTPAPRPKVAPPAPPVAAAPPVPEPPPPPPPRPETLVAEARTLRGEGDFAGARARLEAALAASPAHEDARLELADLLVADGRELARAAELLVVEPGSRTGLRYHLVSATLAEALGDDVYAAEQYALALAAAEDPHARLRRALALERLGRGDEAIPELERVRAARPADAVVRSRLAERYEQAGRTEDAEAEYRWLAEDQPDRAAPWERLARFYERTGRAKAARQALERARGATAGTGRALRPLLPSRL